jgi:acetylornithine/succinyldiaminopimelate/putrescine aminotransferase
MLPELITQIPGPASRALAVRLRSCESRNVTYLADDFPVFWQRAEGTNVWDSDGNRFLDLTGAFAVASLGHGNPAITGALIDQAGTLLHGMGDVHPSELKVQLCEQLSKLTFERWGADPGKSVLGCSGFEAVEAALKTAHLATGKPGIITFEGGYHGTGYGTLAAGAMPRFRDPFTSQLAEIGKVMPFGMAGVEQVRSALAIGDVGAVLVEPVLGRGGKVVPEAEFLPALRALCDEFGALLIFDEIYTGLNRTGKLFACEHWNVVPDLICVGKALTGGFPLSACVGKADVMDAWPESDGEAIHTATFLGHPVGCAMALASLKQHADPATADTVSATGERFRAALAAINVPGIGKVRGLGLMLGLELPAGTDSGALIAAALRHGIILLADGPGGGVLAFAPPFAISDKEIAFACRWLQEYLTSLLGSSS